MAEQDKQNFFQGLLGDFTKSLKGTPGEPNRFFQSAAADDPAPGGQAGLVKLFKRMQSNSMDKSGLEDFVLQLMLRNAIGKSQMPASAVTPQAPQIPQPGLPPSTGGALPRFN